MLGISSGSGRFFFLKGFEILGSKDAIANRDQRITNFDLRIRHEIAEHPDQRGYLLNGLKVNPDMIEIHASLKKLYMLKKNIEKANFHNERMQEIQIAGLLGG